MTVERIPDPSVEDLKRTISDPSKEVGRLRLLQEQRIQTCKENATPTSPARSPGDGSTDFVAAGAKMLLLWRVRAPHPRLCREKEAVAEGRR